MAGMTKLTGMTGAKDFEGHGHRNDLNYGMEVRSPVFKSPVFATAYGIST